MSHVGNNSSLQLRERVYKEYNYLKRCCGPRRHRIRPRKRPESTSTHNLKHRGAARSQHRRHFDSKCALGRNKSEITLLRRKHDGGRSRPLALHKYRLLSVSWGIFGVQCVLKCSRRRRKLQKGSRLTLKPCSAPQKPRSARRTRSKRR